MDTSTLLCAPCPCPPTHDSTRDSTRPTVQHAPPYMQVQVQVLSRSWSLQAHSRIQDASPVPPVLPVPPVPPIPQHFLAPPAPAPVPVPDEAPPSYAEIEWTVKVPRRRVSRREREREQDQAYLLA